LGETRWTGVVIRRYRQSDFDAAARLVLKVFLKAVLPDATPEGAQRWPIFLNPRGGNGERLRESYSRETIGFVAVEGEKIVGVVMGTTGELKRIFVSERVQGQGIGRRLLRRFEDECVRQGGKQYRIVSALGAVRFYEEAGCKKTTGIRSMYGLRVQPMRKVLRKDVDQR
jgi:GNAT superfamily N-acetyltransferase